MRQGMQVETSNGPSEGALGPHGAKACPRAVRVALSERGQPLRIAAPAPLSDGFDARLSQLAGL